MTGFGRIVVGVDFRSGGRDALALAGLLRCDDGEELIAAHVYPFDRSVSVEHAEEFEWGLNDQLSAQLSAELAAAGARATPVVLADGHPARALHALAEQVGAGLVVIGSAHRAGPYRLLLGDTAAGLLPGAPCAVAVAPRGLAPGGRRLRTIGVGYDGSREARAALELARALADRAGAGLRVCAVAPRPPAPWPTSVSAAWPEPEPDAAAARTAGRMAAEGMAEAGGRATGAALVGDAGAALVRCSRDLDLLVLGSRSYGPVRRLLLGSTSTKLVHRSACPVLVLPRSAAAAAARSAAAR